MAAMQAVMEFLLKWFKRVVLLLPLLFASILLVLRGGNRKPRVLLPLRSLADHAKAVQAIRESLLQWLRTRAPNDRLVVQRAESDTNPSNRTTGCGYKASLLCHVLCNAPFSRHLLV